MKQCIQRIQTDSKYAIGWVTISFFIITILSSLLFLSKTITEIKDWSQSTTYPTNTITVSGIGEVIAVPDIATFTFSVDFTGESVESAQEESAKKINAAIKYLKDNNINEKDIKTTGYNLYPRYEYIPCVGINCGQSERKLVGYEVTQSILVKVRETDRAGEILSGIGAQGVNNVSGLSFTIDDKDALKEEARSLAVKDAREKAARLAKDLGVKVKKVVNFNEFSDGPVQYGYGGDSISESFSVKNIAPDLPKGENTISINVSVTYEIK